MGILLASKAEYRSGIPNSFAFRVGAAIVFSIATPIVCDGSTVGSEWSSAVSGSWTEGGNWSSAPFPPNNDAPNANDEYDVLIGASGTPYVVLLTEQVAVKSVTLSSPDATLSLGNSRLETPAINLLSGTLMLGANTPGFFGDRAEVVGATITGGGSIVLTSNSQFAVPTLDGVSLGVDLLMTTAGGSPPRPRLAIRNGLEVQTGTTFTIEGRDALVDIEGSQSLSGGGEIRFQDPSTFVRSGTLRMSEGATLTIGPDLEVRAVSMGGSIGGVGNTGQFNANISLVNDGLLSGEADNQPLQIMNAVTASGVSFQNNGVVQAIGNGVAVVGGDWTNSGTFRIRDNGTLALSGVFTPADIGTIDRQGGQLLIAGRVDNNGSSLTASAATGNLELRTSGQYFFAEPTRIVGGVIDATDGATWTFRSGTLEDVTLATDITIPSASGLDIIGDLTLQGVTLTLTSTDDLTNNAVGHFRETGVSQEIRGPGTIRFGAGRGNAIDTGSELIVRSDVTVEASGRLGEFRGQRLISEGTLKALVDSQFRIAVGDFVNRGSLDVAGNVTIGRDDASTWSNEGTITIRPGGRLNLDGTIAVTDLGALIDEGADYVRLLGTIDNTGQTLDLESLNLTVPLTLASGGIRGGVVTSSGSATLGFADFGVFDGVTLATDITIPGSSGRMFVENGLTLDGATMTVEEGASLLFAAEGPQLIDGVGTIALPNLPQTSAITRISGSELVIGENIVIDLGDEGFREAQLVFRENKGTIVADSPGTLVTLGVSSGSASGTFRWKNRGVIRVDGSEMRLFGAYSVEDIGTVELLSGRFLLFGTLENEGRTVRLDQATGPWGFRGRINGGRVETADGLIADLRGEAVGVTLGGDGAISDETNSSATGALRVIDRLTLDGGRLVIGNDAQLDIIDAIEIDGQGEIVFGGASASRSLIQLYTGSHLTIGAGIMVRTGQAGDGQISRSTLPVVNHGALVADARDRSLTLAGNLTNNGLILAANRGTIRLNPSAFVNQGRIEIDDGALVVNSAGALNGPLGEVLIVGNASIDFAAAGTYVNEGQFYLENSVLTMSGQVFVNAPTGVLAGQALIQQKLLTNLEFVNEGLLAPGGSRGVLAFVTRTSRLAETSKIEIDLGGTESDEYDEVAFLGDAVLGGIIEVLLKDGFELAPNQVFTVVTVQGSRLSEFAGLTEGSVAGAFNGVPLHITYLGGDGNDVAFYTIPEPTGACLAVSGLIYAVASAELRRIRRLVCNLA